MNVTKADFRKIADYLWEIPVSARTGMRVPALVFAREEMLEQLMSDRSLDQLLYVATLPGIQKAAIMMPDAHEGYGFPNQTHFALPIQLLCARPIPFARQVWARHPMSWPEQQEVWKQALDPLVMVPEDDCRARPQKNWLVAPR